MILRRLLTGNISTSSHAIDRALGLTIQSNQAAGVNVPAVQHLRGGELVLAENPNGSTMTYLYDALGRPTGQIDSSAGTNQKWTPFFDQLCLIYSYDRSL